MTHTFSMEVDHVDQSFKEAIPIFVKLNYKCTDFDSDPKVVQLSAKKQIQILVSTVKCWRSCSSEEQLQWKKKSLLQAKPIVLFTSVVYWNYLQSLLHTRALTKAKFVCKFVPVCVLPFVLLNGPGKACPFCLSESLFSHHRCGQWLTQMFYNRHGAVPCLVHVYACAHARFESEWVIQLSSLVGRFAKYSC